MSDKSYEVTDTLDVTGLMCPMPLVKARKTIMKMNIGDTLEVIATDKGSSKDFQGWVKAAKNVELVEQREEDDDGVMLYYHVIRRIK